LEIPALYFKENIEFMRFWRELAEKPRASVART
jgi:hypothetical protein